MITFRQKYAYIMINLIFSLKNVFKIYMQKIKENFISFRNMFLKIKMNLTLI